jgi:hypothetical protein
VVSAASASEETATPSAATVEVARFHWSQAGPTSWASESTSTESCKTGSVVTPGGTFYGRTAQEWGELEAAALTFLIEQARLERTTSYTELNTVLRQRTSARTFDFDLESERAAMGELLGRVVLTDMGTSGHMISSIVIYLNENDAGPGFYKFAQSLNRLSSKATRDQKEAFWADEIREIHHFYRR